MIWPRTSIGSGWPASISGSRRAWAASRAVYMTPVMRTRSPALSDSTSASESGGVMSLVPSAPRVIIALTPSRAGSQRHLFVAVRVALDRDRHRQARDVARIGQDVDAEGGGVAAVALGPDPEPVGALEHLALHRGHRRVGVGRPQLAEQRLLAQARGLLESAPHPHPRDQGRAGIGTPGADAPDDPLLHPLHPLGGGEHLLLPAGLPPPPPTIPILAHGGGRQNPPKDNTLNPETT